MAKPLTITVSKKKAVLAAAVAVAVGFSGLAISGAYFTDEVSSSANSAAAATVHLGTIGATDNAPVSFTNILPSAGGASANVSTINIKNIGTAAIDWAATLSLPASATSDQQAFAGQLNMQTSTDGGTTWSTATTLAAFTNSATPGSITSSTSLAAPVGATPSTASVLFRLWLPAATLNVYQGKSVTFNVRVRAIQAGAPAGSLTTETNFAPSNPLPAK